MPLGRSGPTRAVLPESATEEPNSAVVATSEAVSSTCWAARTLTPAGCDGEALALTVAKTLTSATPTTASATTVRVRIAPSSARRWWEQATSRHRRTECLPSPGCLRRDAAGLHEDAQRRDGGGARRRRRGRGPTGGPGDRGAQENQGRDRGKQRTETERGEGEHGMTSWSSPTTFGRSDAGYRQRFTERSTASRTKARLATSPRTPRTVGQPPQYGEISMLWKRPCLVLAALVLVGTLVASCGGTKHASVQGTPAPSVSPSPPLALAQEISSLDRLVVRRTDAFPQNHIRFSFPAVMTVSDAARVQRVARALLALPAMPKGVFCPADSGIVYHLTFFDGGHALPAISFDATGCEAVRGLGVTRWGGPLSRLLAHARACDGAHRGQQRDLPREPASRLSDSWSCNVTGERPARFQRQGLAG